MTCGAKFGGDFLVYQDDPALVHSQFILVCIEHVENYASLTLKELITYARMATCVKKTFLLAFCNNNTSKTKTRYQDKWSLSTTSMTSKVINTDGLILISINWSHL